MRSEKLGEGDPEAAVMYQVHGDESVGRAAAKRFKDEGFELQKPVEFIKANPAAADEGERFIDEDLNRSFPGNPESDVYEERLAYRLGKRLEGMKVLDLHSTDSRPTPFCIVQRPEVVENAGVAKLGVENIVDFSFLSEAQIRGADRVAVEFDGSGSRDAVENAYKVLLRFLAAQGVIERSVQERTMEVFEVFGTADGAGYRFVGQNFQKVEEGEIFARREGDELRADKAFYPVLMSTEGYEEMVGFKARRLEVV